MPLTSWVWVQITASAAKSTWLAQHGKREILGNNADTCLHSKGKINIKGPREI